MNNTKKHIKADYTLKYIEENYNTEEKCFTFLENVLGTNCKKCSCKKVYRLQDKRFKCSKCKHRYSIKKDTMFDNTNINLTIWFKAIYLLSTSSKGISSIQLATLLGVRQPTAWFMYYRIRKSFTKNQDIFRGTIEIDETFVGGKEKNKHASQKNCPLPQKAVVIGTINRDTKQIKANYIPNTKAMTLKSYIYNNVELGSHVYTDDYNGYKKMQPALNHKTTTHSIGNYVNGNVHTNSIESFWSIFKRGYIGVYHYMSVKHLQRFIDEYTFRYNNKYENKFNIAMSNIKNTKLSYNKLIN